MTAHKPFQKYRTNNEAYWFFSYFDTFRSYYYLLDQIGVLAWRLILLICRLFVFRFFILISLSFNCKRPWLSTDSIGLSGALIIVFMESDGVKRPLRSTESSHMHLIHSLKPCFLCVQSSLAAIDFLYPPLQWLLNTNRYVIEILERGCHWNNTSRKCRQSKHFLGLSRSNFPSCAMEKIRSPSSLLSNRRLVFFSRILPQMLSKF